MPDHFRRFPLPQPFTSPKAALRILHALRHFQNMKHPQLTSPELQIERRPNVGSTIYSVAARREAISFSKVDRTPELGTSPPARLDDEPYGIDGPVKLVLASLFSCARSEHVSPELPELTAGLRTAIAKGAN